MCYSAQIQADYRKYVARFGAGISLREFHRLYWEHRGNPKIRLPKAMDAAFATPKSPEEQAIAELIAAANDAQATRLERELFAQKQRLNGAVRALAAKPTKKAAEDRRIATNKIEAAQRRLSDLRRTRLEPRDSRIYPGTYAPVLVGRPGGCEVLPMRYQCRPAGKPAAYDAKYPGTYNARRDNLEGFWKDLFGHSHALVVIDTFFENVEGPDGSNRVLQFTPRDGSDMLVACLWSRWTDPQGRQPDLLSFAAITDEPEPEVAAAGHDRTIINLKPEHVDAWLHPDPANLAALYAMFDDRRRPYYEHRIAA